MREGRDPFRRDAAAIAAERRRFIEQIAILLEASQVVRDPGSRKVFFDMLRDALLGDLPVREVDFLRPQLVALINACIDRAALRTLAECVHLLEPGSAQTHEILRAADQWQLAEQFQQYDLDWLRPHLTNVRITQGLRQFVLDLRNEPVPEYCEHAWHLLAYLSSTNPVDGLPPWLQLLHRLITVVPAARQLPSLVWQLADDWGAVDQLGATQFRRSARPDHRDTAYLVIQFEKWGGEENTFIVSHWYQWAKPVWQPIPGGSEHVSYADLEAAVDKLVLAAEQRWSDQIGDVAIEFVLPWQLLNEPVDQWRKELDSPVPSPLAMEYPLVVRSLERIRAHQWHRIWRGRGQRLLRPAGGEDRHYCATGEQSAVQLEATLKGKADAVVLVLSEPPALNSVGQQEVLAGLRSGLPAIVWHRGEASVSGQLCETVTSMIGHAESASGLAELPKHAAKLRQAAWSEDPDQCNHHIGHDFAILWDDPDRQPGQAGSAGDTGEVRR
jgi:hypothetical protein